MLPMDTTLSQRNSSNDANSTFFEGAKKQVILSEPQRLALEWLMGGGSVGEAGQYAGVSRQAVSHWLHHDEDFREVFESWQLQIQNMNKARLMAISESAVDTVAVAIREKHDARVALAVLKAMGMLGTGK